MSARGPKIVLVIGSVIIAAGYLAGTLMLGSPVGLMVLGLIVSFGVGFAFAALPALINAAVPVSETASANSINSLARSLGTSTSSAVMTAVLAQMTIMSAGHALPSLGGFRTALLTPRPRPPVPPSLPWRYRRPRAGCQSVAIS